MILFYLAIPAVVLVTILYSLAAALTRPIDVNAGIYHLLMRQWSKILLRLLRVRVTANGVEHIDRSKSYVYISNHSSYLDILAIGAAVPDEVLFVFKEELAKVPIWGWSLRVSPHIIIDRADPRNALASIERAARKIRKRGFSVVIFPEGTRSKDGTLGDFKRGGFLLATKTGVPIVPMAIKGSYSLLPRGEWRVRPGTIEVILGRPIPGRSDLSRSEEREVQLETQRRLADMLGIETPEPEEKRLAEI